MSSSKMIAIAGFFAALAAASPLAARQATYSQLLVNQITDGTVINYAVIEEAPAEGCVADNNNCVVTSGSLSQGQSVALRMNPPTTGGYSVKLCSGTCDPATQGANGILQYETTLTQNDASYISYDWSCVNCDPNPFMAYQYSMVPYAGAPIESGTNQCETITCAAGTSDTDDSCQFGYMMTTSYPVPNCPIGSTTGNLISAIISS